MSRRLRSVGIDVGTTSTQLIVSLLTVENRASAFAVPELVIGGREILYKSPVHFTPLRDERLVDEQALRELILREYAQAGLTRDTVDTGAVIITGETSRKENARRTLSALSDLAGDFVVAAAGPDLESVLAARGSGAADESARTGKTLLHMDIGGGTANLALIQGGRILRTGCMNIGGRLVKRDSDGNITYVSPVLKGLWAPETGTLEDLARLLAQALEMAAGLREPTALLTRLLTAEAGPWEPPVGAIPSFSGGVAVCIGRAFPDNAFGDIGPLLGKAIGQSLLCRGEYRLAGEAIRATVIGAGCYATQLSGSTVFAQNVRFPLKNLAVEEEGGPRAEGASILALPGFPAPSYAQVAALAQKLAQRGAPVRVCLEADMAKALGQALAVRLPKGAEILCLDRVRAGTGSYLDIGEPVGAAFPVVVKTLVTGIANEGGNT